MGAVLCPKPCVFSPFNLPGANLSPSWLPAPAALLPVAERGVVRGGCTEIWGDFDLWGRWGRQNIARKAPRGEGRVLCEGRR